MVRKSSSFGVVIWLLVGSVTFYKSSLVLAEDLTRKNATPSVKNMNSSTGHTTISKDTFPNGSKQTVVQQNDNEAHDNHQTSKPANDTNTVQQNGNEAPDDHQTSKPANDTNTVRQNGNEAHDNQQTSKPANDTNTVRQNGNEAHDDQQTSKPANDTNTVRQNGNETPDDQQTSKPANDTNTVQQNGNETPDNHQTSKPANDTNTVQQNGNEAPDDHQTAKPANDMNTVRQNGNEARDKQTSKPTTNVNIVHDVTQQSGSTFISISDVLLRTSQSTTANKADKKPFATDAVVTQTSALGTRTTPKVPFKSDINVAATPAVEDDHFIMYLILGLLLLSVVYIAYHNKNKIISMCQKGGPKRTKRPKTSDYQRLDQNLSEVITSLKKKSNFKMS